MPREQNAGQNCDIKISNKFLQVWKSSNICEQPKQVNYVRAEIKSVLNYGNAWLPFGAEPFVFPFASKNIKMKIYGVIILLVVFNWCETWFLILKQENSLIVF